MSSCEISCLSSLLCSLVFKHSFQYLKIKLRWSLPCAQGTKTQRWIFGCQALQRKSCLVPSEWQKCWVKSQPDCLRKNNGNISNSRTEEESLCTAWVSYKSIKDNSSVTWAAALIWWTFKGRKSLRAFQATAEQRNKKQIGQNKSIPESWKAGVQRGMEKTERLQLNSCWYHPYVYEPTYIGLLPDQITCVNPSFLLFFPSNSHTVFLLLWYFLLKALRQTEKKLFFPFVQVPRKLGENRRGFRLANSAHLVGTEVWSLFDICFCWEKFALRITVKNNLACITSLVGCSIFNQMHSSPRSKTRYIILPQENRKLRCLHLFQIQLNTKVESTVWAFCLRFKITNCAVLALMV